MSIISTIQKLPLMPGIYIYKDNKGKILYIGKAKNLRNRVRSYFEFIRSHKEKNFSARAKGLRPAKDLEPSKRLMVSKIASIDYTVTDNETEALLLETTLIKKHRPHFNIVMRDDKSFKYIKVDLDAEWPMIYTVRRIPPTGKNARHMKKIKSKYFGPYASSRSVNESLKLIKSIFPYCANPPKRNRRKQPCFQYHLKRCPGVCMGEISHEEYMIHINSIISFLEGDYKTVITKAVKGMDAASQKRRYELAARLRDQIEAVKKIMEKQKMIAVRDKSEDYISIARGEKRAASNIFIVRHGRLIDKRNYILENVDKKSDTDLLEAFIEQYYSQSLDVPEELVVEIMPSGIAQAADVRAEGLGLKVAASLLRKLGVKRVTAPKRGTKLKMLQLGKENAREYMVQRAASFEREYIKAKFALEELAREVGLTGAPRRVEIYDISNIQGKNAVGAMAVFEEGMPKKSEYRKFTIKTLETPDDVGMMEEVIRRRFDYVKSDRDHPELPIPDLLIIDGGRGQLSVVMKVLMELEMDIAVISLAKREEEIFLPHKSDSIRLKKDSEALHLVQRMRDETHRFAISFYRSKHRKGSNRSILDEIPGIGPKTKKKLLQAFGSVAGIRNAKNEVIVKVVGKKTAKILEEF